MSGPDRDLEKFSHFFFSDRTESEIDSEQGSPAGPRPPDIDYSAGHGTLKNFHFFSPIGRTHVCAHVWPTPPRPGAKAKGFICIQARANVHTSPAYRPPAAARIQSKTTIFQQAGGSTTLLFRLLLPDFGRKRKTPPECRPHAAARFQRKNTILQQGVRKTRTAQVLNI